MEMHFIEGKLGTHEKGTWSEYLPSIVTIVFELFQSLNARQ